MRIRFVSLYFSPESGAAQRRLSDLVRILVQSGGQGAGSEAGHEITVLTGFPNYPSGIKPVGYRKRLFMIEKKDGYRIVRVPHYVAPNRGFFKRLMIHISFAISASLVTPFLKRDDIVYLESPPLFNGFIGLVGRWFRRIPYLFNVADLWPQTAVEMGLLKNRAVISFSEALEKLFYNQSAKILAITAGLQKSLLSRGYPEQKVPLITNGVDCDQFDSDIEPDTELSSYRPDGGLLVIYAGTHGLIYSLDTLLEAAQKMLDEPIHFLMIGDGADKTRLVDLAQNMKLTNVTFLPPYQPEDMPSVFRTADVTVVSLRDLPISNAIMPVKCFEIMASAIPVILAARGEMAGHIYVSGGGSVIDPERVDRLTAELRKYGKMSIAERREIGLQGRAYVMRHFSRQKTVRELEFIMEEVVAGGR